VYKTTSMKNKLLYILCILFINSCVSKQIINRFNLVNRHNINHSNKDSLSSLSLGNGQFAFTVDITGLQTFPESYERGIPLGTMADWAWHNFPNPGKYSLKDVVRYYKVANDSVPYYYQFSSELKDRRSLATEWLRENPHRFHLGLIGLELLKADSSEVSMEDIKNPVQKLNLWTGEISSTFEIEGTPVHVITLCDQNRDRICVHIESKLIQSGRLKIELKFPYARHDKFSPGYDFCRPEKHFSQIVENELNYCVIRHQLDETVYYSRIDWEEKTKIVETANHTFLIKPDKTLNYYDFSVAFSEKIIENTLPGFSKSSDQNKRDWKNFWSSGGAVDFSACTDSRAFELERRVVLSQYLTKIQCTGLYPPQETGLTYNSWHGKFHLEMHWWHALHFILWNRGNLIENQLDYYSKIFEKAKQTAGFQGYNGIRWPKMTDPSGRESPSNVGVFLIWQQPHLIYFADLIYNSKNHDKKILDKYSKLVFATADFMASYARYDSSRNEYVLGPALIPAQERFDPKTTMNPSFELAYWYWGLETAQKWKERLGFQRDTLWQKVIDRLSPLPVKDSLYLFAETAPDSYSNEQYLTDHPMVLGLMGFLPETPKVDRKILLKTQEAILKKWKWETCWGWDFPLLALNAAALDKPDLALDLLLMKTQKNRYLNNGHNYQEDRLTLYLPGNGGLLTAVAMMCTYKNKNGQNGFPQNGKWKVKYENLQPMY
jgi:protein-glucosylgalactosylhydroxylysine glucosidase